MKEALKLYIKKKKKKKIKEQNEVPAYSCNCLPIIFNIEDNWLKIIKPQDNYYLWCNLDAVTVNVITQENSYDTPSWVLEKIYTKIDYFIT